MPYSPLLFLHISGGLVGLLSGAAAMTFRKGSRWHGLSGNVFFVSMLAMSSAGATLATIKHQLGNIVGGTLTFYLVATAWSTARRRDGETNRSDWLALLSSSAVGMILIALGLQVVLNHAPSPGGVPTPMYFIMGSIALLCGAGDLRMLLRGGLFGKQRIVRHLWRMCFALFVASGSLFLARPHLFPMILRETYVIFTLGILPLPLMLFWLLRVRFAAAFRSRRTIAKPRAQATPFLVSG